MTKVPDVKTAKGSLLVGGLNGMAVGTFGPPDAPPVQKTFNFPLQSFFDYRFADVAFYPANASAALLAQPTPNPIVTNGMKHLDEGGYGLAAPPGNDCPLAVEVAGVGGARSTIIMLPGQVVFPFSSEGKKQGFESLNVGLPQGWLGGGWASLLVLKSPKSWVTFGAVEKDVLFHRFQTRIREASLDAPTPVPLNWPTTFPWQRARRGRYDPGTTTPSGRFEDQNGTTTISIRKITRTLMVLRGHIPLDGTGAPPDNYMRIVWWSTDHFDAGVNGLDVPVPGVGSAEFFFDVTWPTNQGTVPTMPAHDPIINLDPAFAAQRSSLYGISLDAPAGSPLIGATVDCCRYGIL